MTWQQVMLEWQRNWANKEAYDAVTDLIWQYSGAYRFGIEYTKTMVHGMLQNIEK